MRPMLTVASSRTPHLPWWRNVSMPSKMLTKAISTVTRNIAEKAPRDGVAVVIRVPPPMPCFACGGDTEENGRCSGCDERQGECWCPHENPR